PAERAGLQHGDVVVQIADARVNCGLDLERAMLDRPAGEHVPVVVRRNGNEQRLDLVLQTVERTMAAPSDLIWRKLGIRLQAVSAELVSRSHQQLHGGLAIVEVNPEGAASKAGILRGDILIGLHQWETLNVD